MRTKIRSLAALAILTQLLPGTATAHDKGNSGNVATSSSYCVNESVLLREDAKDDGYVRGRVRTYKGGCSTPVNRPEHNLAQTFYVYFSKTETGPQQACMYSDFYYNPKPEWGFQAELLFPPRPYCGAGWYEIHAYGYLWQDGQWRSGLIRSGRHYFNV